jgi:hypothetical protein
VKRAIFLLAAGALLSGVAAFAVSAKPEPVAMRAP